MPLSLAELDKYESAFSGDIDLDAYERAFEAPAPALLAPETRGPLESVGAGLTHGGIGILESIGTGTQWLGNRLGWKPMAEAGEVSSEYWENKAARFGPSKDIAGKNVWDNPELLANSTYWLYNVSDMVPWLVAAMAPGAGAARAIQAITAIPKLAQIGGAIAGGFVVGGGMEAAQTYKAVLEKGGPEEEAARSAELMWLGAGTLNAFGVGKILSKAGAGFKGRVLKHLGAASWEGMTEGLEEPTEVFAKYFGAYLSDQPLPNDIKEQLIASAKDALTVAPIAGITGGGASVLGGAEPTPSAPPPVPEPEVKPGLLSRVAPATTADEAIAGFEAEIGEPSLDVELAPSTAEESARVLVGDQVVDDATAREIMTRYGIPIPDLSYKSAEESAEAFAPEKQVARDFRARPTEYAPPMDRVRQAEELAQAEIDKYVEPEPGVEAIDALANEAATSPENIKPEPTDEQKKAGNAELGHIPGKLLNLSGMSISIENPRGSVRTEIKPDDAPADWKPSWTQEMQHHYGFFKRTEGKDGDQIDVFVGPAVGSRKAFIVDQIDPETGRFDEHKTLIAFKDIESARAGYLANYEKGWKGMGAISELPIEEFKEWIGDGTRKTEAYAEKVTLPSKTPAVEGTLDRTPVNSDLLSDLAIIEPKIEEVYGKADIPFQRIGVRRVGAPPVRPISDTEALESSSDNIDRAIKEGGNITSTLAAIPEGEKFGIGKLDDITRKVISSVAALRGANSEIFGRIVESIPVDVMDDFISKELSAEDFFHDDSMFSDFFAVDADAPVKGFYRRVVFALLSGLKGSRAGTVAKFSFIPDLAWLSDKGIATKVTNEFHEDSLSQLETPSQEESAEALAEELGLKYIGEADGLYYFNHGNATIATKGINRDELVEKMKRVEPYKDKVPGEVQKPKGRFYSALSGEEKALYDEWLELGRKEMLRMHRMANVSAQGIKTDADLAESLIRIRRRSLKQQVKLPPPSPPEPTITEEVEPLPTKKQKALQEYQDYISSLTADQKTSAGDLIVDEPESPGTQRLKIERAIFTKLPIVPKEIIATDKIGDIEYEFRVAPVNDPSMPQMTHHVQMRRKGSDNEWEHAMTGYGTSRKNALRFFAERYSRIGNIENLNVIDDRLKPFVDDELGKVAKKEAERKQTELEAEKNRGADIKELERLRGNEQIIQDELKKAKAKKVAFRVKDQDGKTVEEIPEVSALSFGDFAYHKSVGYAGEQKGGYSVTHVSSSMAVQRELDSKEARELAYRLSFIETKWNGKKEPPKAFKDTVYNTVSDFRKREPITLIAVETPEETLKESVKAEETGIKEVKPKPKADVIEDFGEKLGGARKDYYAQYADRMAEAKETDIAAVPLSKSWPEPDYQKLIEDGTDPWTVAFIRSARDEIPLKPRQPWKQKRWVEQVRMLRGFADDVLSDKVTKKKMQDALEKPEYSIVKKEVGGRTDLYVEFGHDKSMKGITLKENHYSIYRGEKDVTKWQIEQSRKATALSNMPRELGVGNTKDEAITSFKEKYDSLGEKIEPTRLVKFDIYSKREEAGVWIGKKIGRNYVDLKKFDNAKDAMEYRKENRDDLVKALEQYKTIPFERREVNRERIGKDHRNGKDVTPEMFTEFFGFRGVEFGNWVNSQERQDNLNRAFDALMDMSIILDIPTKAISLNGELGLGFGSRGIGGKRAPAAHYEPSKVVINLTRKSGPGSLAHEWWHALDNYFSRGRGKKLEYISDRATKFQDDPTRIEILDAFKNVVATIDNTGMKKRAAELDRRRTKPYWTKGIELSARAFENYMVERLSQRGDVNDYLVNIESAESYGADMMEGLLSGDLTAMDMYPYLIESEIENVSNAFNHLFNTMESKETDKGVELYSTQVSDIPGLTLDDVQKMFKGQTVGLSPDGAIWVRTTGGNGLRIEMVSRIDADNAAFEFGYGRMGKDETLSGKYHKGTIFLQRDIADRWTLAHESMHWMEDAGIVNAKESEVLKAYIRGMVKKGTFLTLNEKDIGGREDRAQFISDSLRERGGLSNPIQRVIQKIQDFIDGLVNLFHRTAMGITRDIETGKIYDRGMRRAGIPTEAIAYQKTADRWYSQMEREISSPKFPNRGTPQSMANIINSWAKKGMIKDEELQWSGLLDWLKDQEGKVSKQDVLDYLSANNLRLEEVVKGGPKLTKEQSDRLEELSEWDEAGNLSEAEAQEYEQLSSLVRQYKQEGGYGTKFSKYQMPGGENYREMLITMPAKKRPDTFDEWVKLESKGDLPTSTPFNDLPEHMKTILVNRFDKYFPAEKGYVGTHWEEPNVLAHVRMNDRTGPKGEKVLFIEELQSDFGQAYRKQLKNIENAVDNNLKDIVRSMEKSGVLKEIC